MCETAGIGPGHDDDFPFGRPDCFGEENRRHVPGRLVGMRAAEDEEISSFCRAGEDKNLSISRRVFEGRKIIAQHLFCRQARTRKNCVLRVHAQELAAGKESDDQRER